MDLFGALSILDLGEARKFLFLFSWGAAMTPQTVERKLTAVLSAGVEGYRRLTGEDDVATVRTLQIGSCRGEISGRDCPCPDADGEREWRQPGFRGWQRQIDAFARGLIRMDRCRTVHSLEVFSVPSVYEKGEKCIDREKSK